MIAQNLVKLTQQLPVKLINAVQCILEDIATVVKIFGVTRKTHVPYASYINKAGRLVSGFLKREILCSFKGIHVGFKNGAAVYTDLETGEQTVVRFGYGDIVEVVGDRNGCELIWQTGKVLDAYADGWVSVQLERKLFQFRAEDLVLIEKAPEKTSSLVNHKAVKFVTSWKPDKGIKQACQKYLKQRDWTKEPDEVVFAAAEEAKLSLGV